MRISVQKILLTSIACLALYGVAWATNNYRISNPGGVVTTLKSTDTGGVHVPHVNIDTMPTVTVDTTGLATSAKQDTGITAAQPATNFTTSQVTVTTASTEVCPVRALRRACIITQITGSQQVFCSGTTATSGNGQFIPASVAASFKADTAAAINCIAISSSQTVSVAEIF